MDMSTVGKDLKERNEQIIAEANFRKWFEEHPDATAEEIRYKLVKELSDARRRAVNG